MSYSTDLVQEVAGIFSNSVGGFSTSMIVVLLVFVNEQLLGRAKAKLFFALGYFISLIIFFTVGVLCFPANGKGGEGSEGGEEDGEDNGDLGDGEDDGDFGGESAGKSGSLASLLPAGFQKQMLSLIPMQRVTTASFFTFSIGYMLGYWANLNLAKKTENATTNMVVYLGIAFAFYIFTVFLIKSCSWTSGLISICTGTIFGMVWSQMVADKVDAITPASDNSRGGRATSSGGGGAANEGSVCDGSSSDDMVCNAFRL